LKKTKAKPLSWKKFDYREIEIIKPEIKMMKKELSKTKVIK
jgi:hypothetical protein